MTSTTLVGLFALLSLAACTTPSPTPTPAGDVIQIAPGPKPRGGIDSDGDGLVDGQDPFPLIADYSLLSWQITSIQIGWKAKVEQRLTQQESLKWDKESVDVKVEGDREKILGKAGGEVGGKVKGELNKNPLRLFGLLDLEVSVQAQANAGLSYTRELEWNTSRRSQSRSASEYVRRLESEMRLDDPYLAVWITFYIHSPDDLTLQTAPLPIFVGGEPITNAEHVKGGNLMLPAKRPEGISEQFLAKLDTTETLKFLSELEGGPPSAWLERSRMVIRDPRGADAISATKQIEAKTTLVTVSDGDLSYSWRVAATDQTRNRAITVRQALELVSARLKRLLPDRDLFQFDKTGLARVAGIPVASDGGQWSMLIDGQRVDDLGGATLDRQVRGSGAVQLAFQRTALRDVDSGAPYHTDIEPKFDVATPRTVPAHDQLPRIEPPQFPLEELNAMRFSRAEKTAEAIDAGMKALEKAAATYKSAPGITDTVTLTMKSPMGDQSDSMKIVLGAGSDGMIIMGDTEIVSTGGKLMFASGMFGDKYVAVPLSGGMGSTLATKLEGVDLPVPHVTLREGATGAALVKAFGFGPFSFNRVGGSRSTGRVREVLLVGDNECDALILIDSQTDLIHASRIVVTPPNAPPGLRIGVTLQMEPRIVNPPPLVTFTPNGRVPVQTLAEAMPEDQVDEPLVITVGRMAPNFALKQLSGVETKLSNLKGSVVVLSFWATWCSPCSKTLPKLNDFAKWASASRENVKVFGVNVWERGAGGISIAAVSEYWRNGAFAFPTLLGDDDIAKAYGVDGIPVTVVVGPDGKVVSVYQGFERDLVEKLKQDVHQSIR